MAEGYGTAFDEASVAEAAGGTAILGIPGASAEAGGIALGTGTGQHGAVPVSSDNGGIIDSFFDWLTQPLIGNASPRAIFLLIGVVFISIILWNLVLYNLRIAGEELA
jgi:hypothetical protein